MIGEIISFWKHKLPDKEPLDKATYPHFKHLETNFLDSQKMCEETSPLGSDPPETDQGLIEIIDDNRIRSA